jgi:hypothetical protein
MSQLEPPPPRWAAAVLMASPPVVVFLLLEIWQESFTPEQVTTLAGSIFVAVGWTYYALSTDHCALRDRVDRLERSIRALTESAESRD